MKKVFLFGVILVFFACQSGNQKQQSAAPAASAVQVAETTINIGGMHCENCVASVTKGINELEGIDSVAVTLADSTAFVMFDPSKADVEKISKAIEARGYTVKK